MGMYTELNLTFSLEKDTPIQVYNILNYMINGGKFIFDIPNHKLFNTEDLRWEIMLNCTSCYFTDIVASKIELHKCGDYTSVHCHSNFKNYEDEIELFIDWIKSYIHNHDGEKLFLGYSRYEEDENPILYYLYNNNIINKKED